MINLLKYFKRKKDSTIKYNPILKSNPLREKYATVISDQGNIIRDLEIKNAKLIEELRGVREDLKIAIAKMQVSEFISDSSSRTSEAYKKQVSTMIDQQKEYTLKLEEKFFVLDSEIRALKMANYDLTKALEAKNESCNESNRT